VIGRGIEDIEREGIKVTVTQSLMQSAADEARLAEETLAFARGLTRGGN
jgi:hypothetical protein